MTLGSPTIPLTVITVAYNALDALKPTVQSVMKQPLWSVLDYVIIDGGSTDGTVDYLKTLPPSVRWLSEPDQGIYDAMNKGIRMAVGNGLLFLNAGDLLVGDVLMGSIPVPCFLPVKYCHPVLGLKSVPLRSRRMGLPQCHQGIVFERREDILYDLRYRVCADYDLYLRYSYPDRLPMHSCPGYVYYDNTGFSQQRAKERDQEIQGIIRENFGVLAMARFAIVARFKRILRLVLSSLLG